MANSPSAARQAGQASWATIRRIRETRSFASSWRRATAVVEWTERSAPHVTQAAAVSEDWDRQMVQVRNVASSRPLPDSNFGRGSVNPS